MMGGEGGGGEGGGGLAGGEGGAGAGLDTSSGTLLLAKLPVPSWPYEPSPKQKGAPCWLSMQVKRSPASTCRVEPQQCSNNVSSAARPKVTRAMAAEGSQQGGCCEPPLYSQLFLCLSLHGISRSLTWLNESASWLMELRSIGVGSAKKPLLEPVPHCKQAARQQWRGLEGRRSWQPGSETLQARHCWDGSGGRAGHTGRQVPPSAGGCQLRTRSSLLCCLACPAELSPQHSTVRRGEQWARCQEDQTIYRHARNVAMRQLQAN